MRGISGKKVQGQRGGERIEVPPVGRGNAGEPQGLCEGDDRGVDEAEIEIVEAPIQIGNPQICILREVSKQVVAVDDPRVERQTALCAEPHAQQVIDFRNDWCGEI